MGPENTPIAHYPRTPEERISALELAVFGDKLQQIPGLIASVRTMHSELSEIKEIVVKLRDNRLAWVTLATSVVAALGAVVAAYVAAAVQ